MPHHPGSRITLAAVLSLALLPALAAAGALTDLLSRARDEARAILDADPLLDRARHHGLKERALGRYPRALELFRTG